MSANDPSLKKEQWRVWRREGGKKGLKSSLYNLQEESDHILHMASGLKSHQEVALLRAYSRFPKVFSTQLPLTKGHFAHFVLGP